MKLKKTKKKELYIPGKAYSIQEANPRRQKECSCGSVPVGVRLLIQSGSGRWSKTAVFCRSCGVDKLDDAIAKLSVLKEALMTDIGEEDEA